MFDKAIQYLQQKKFFSRFYLNFKIGLKIRKPKLLLRLLENYLAILICRRRLLRTVDFAPTYLCDCNCKHCFASYLRSGEKEAMTLGDYSNTAVQAKKLGAVHFAFQGGEPLLLLDLEEIVRAIDPSDCFVSITTNASLLTEERIVSLKRSGVDMFTISIDSGYTEEHDAFRGKKGLFIKAIDAIKNAIKHNMIVTVNTTVTCQNLASGGFKAMVKLCAQLKVKLNILFPAISGRWAGKTDEMLSDYEKKQIQAIIDKYTFIRRDLDANYYTYGCGAVKEMIYISAYGEVMPCAFIHVSLGNIKKDPLKYCRGKGLRVSYFSDYYPVCPPMEDIDFINKYMSKISASKTLPANFDEIFEDVKSNGQHRLGSLGKL